MAICSALFQALLGLWHHEPPEGHCCVIVLNSSFNCSIGGCDLWSDVIPAITPFTFICTIISASPRHGNAPPTILIKDHFVRTVCWAIKLTFRIGSIVLWCWPLLEMLMLTDFYFQRHSQICIACIFVWISKFLCCRSGTFYSIV